MLNSENEQKLVDAMSEPARLYQDPKLAGSRLACLLSVCNSVL